MTKQIKTQESYAENLKGKTGLKRIFNAFNYSFSGLKTAFLEEAAFRQLFILSIASIICCLFIDFSIIIKMILILTSVLLLIVELFNTAIEAAIDHTSLDKHPLAKKAKDVGSAAQFLALNLFVILWIFALFQYFY